MLSTIGEGESASNVHSYYNHLFVTTLLRGVMKDKAGLEDAVKHSDLECIVIRPAGLSNGDPKGIRM